MNARRSLLVGVLGAAIVACEAAPPAAPVDPATARDRALEALERWEESTRARTEWTQAPPGQRARGPDPIAIERVLRDRWLVALRGADAVALVDASGKELARAPAPAAPRAIAAGADGTVLVVGELDARVARLRAHPDRIETIEHIVVPGAAGLRGVASGRGARGEVVHVVDAIAGEVVTVDARGERLGALALGPGALAVQRQGDIVVAVAVDAHRALACPTDARGVPDEARCVVFSNDGPFWGLDTRVVGEELLVALSHVEDHPLDRTQGSFQFIDSFVRIDALPARAWSRDAIPTPRRVLTLNLSERNVVMPKALRFTNDKTLLVAAAGSARIAAVRLDPAEFTEVRAASPGAAALAPLGDALGVEAMIANPLLDAVVRAEGAGEKVRPIAAARDAAPRRPLARVGEALVFTSLIAPTQRSDGGLSRFTCETCHFEGATDGRIHGTGRGDVRATTKPLFGLANNTPLFTRALDPGLVRMAHNEFRVANANCDHDPWFTVTLEDAPWLAHLGVTQPLTPEVLRQALASFLFELTPETHAPAAARGAFTDEARQGARVFAQRCVRCHAARLVASDARSEVPEARWESLVLSPQGPIVWARDGYELTGIEPLVHERGARTSSLRRISRKTPYFTNGSARTLDEVLSRARFDDAGTFLHASERTDLRALGEEEKRALLAFLRLL